MLMCASKLQRISNHDQVCFSPSLFTQLAECTKTVATVDLYQQQVADIFVLKSDCLVTIAVHTRVDEEMGDLDSAFDYGGSCDEYQQRRDQLFWTCTSA
jgi:hypothetical protein